MHADFDKASQSVPLFFSPILTSLLFWNTKRALGPFWGILGSLSTRVFETRTATGSELFSLLICLYTTTFILLSIFSASEMISVKRWDTPLSWHTKCSLPVAVRVSKTRVLKHPNIPQNGSNKNDRGPIFPSTVPSK